MRAVTRTLWTLAVLGSALVAAAPGFGQDDPASEPAHPETVRALRYRMTVYRSALDVAHRAGTEIEELWFPEAGIVCNTAPGFASDVLANAFYGDRRDGDEYRGFEDDADAERPPPEEIEVPWEVFEQIRGLADLERRRAELSTALRTELESSEILRRRP